MTISFGLILDAIFLLIVVAAALTGLRRGLVSGLLRLVGSIAGIIGAVYATREWALLLYSRHIDPLVQSAVGEALAENGSEAAAVLADKLDFLPAALQAQLTALLETAQTSGGDALVRQVANAVQPILLPMLQAILFLVVLIAIRVVFQLLEALFRRLNDVPLLGEANKLLGFCLGFVTGTIDVWMLSLILWLAANMGDGKWQVLTPANLSSSILYGMLEKLNPFIV